MNECSIRDNNVYNFVYSTKRCRPLCWGASRVRLVGFIYVPEKYWGHGGSASVVSVVSNWEVLLMIGILLGTNAMLVCGLRTTCVPTTRHHCYVICSAPATINGCRTVKKKNDDPYITIGTFVLLEEECGFFCLSIWGSMYYYCSTKQTLVYDMLFNSTHIWIIGVKQKCWEILLGLRLNNSVGYRWMLAKGHPVRWHFVAQNKFRTKLFFFKCVLLLLQFTERLNFHRKINRSWRLMYCR